MALPKPPIKTMTDFVVFCFISIIFLILTGAAITLGVVSVVQPEVDHSQNINKLTDIITTMIGALIGFIAGKGQGRSEVHEEQAVERAEKRADERAKGEE